MAKFGLIKITGLVDTGKRYDIDQAEADSRNSHLGQNKDLRLVPVVNAAPPAYDPATEKLVKANDVVTATEITTTQVVVEMSQAEKDEYADTLDRATKRTSIGGKVTWLRDQGAAAAAVTVTSGNAVARLQDVYDMLEVFLPGFADLIEAQRIDQ